jgi:type II secretory pathway component GspD/PulD (secretin)
MSRGFKLASRRLVIATALLAYLLTWRDNLVAQSPRQIKVLLESQQLVNQNREALQGSAGVVIRRGNAEPSGRVGAVERQTTVQRSSGIFTLVRDGGESILTVATRVPERQVVVYRDWASGLGYVARDIVFREVGTSLKVRASILPGDQVRVRLTPSISWFAPDGSGVIEVNEASTELILPSGRPVVLGGSTTQTHDVLRQILGFRTTQGGSETLMAVTATIR